MYLHCAKVWRIYRSLREDHDYYNRRKVDEQFLKFGKKIASSCACSVVDFLVLDTVKVVSPNLMRPESRLRRQIHLQCVIKMTDTGVCLRVNREVTLDMELQETLVWKGYWTENKFG